MKTLLDGSKKIQTHAQDACYHETSNRSNTKGTPRMLGNILSLSHVLRMLASL